MERWYVSWLFVETQHGREENSICVTALSFVTLSPVISDSTCSEAHILHPVLAACLPLPMLELFTQRKP